MKSKEERKQSNKEVSRKYVRSRLFAMTMGVFLFLRKIPSTKTVSIEKSTASSTKLSPKGSVNERKFISLGRHWSLFLLGNLSSGQSKQSSMSEKQNKDR